MVLKNTMIVSIYVNLIQKSTLVPGGIYFSNKHGKFFEFGRDNSPSVVE